MEYKTALTSESDRSHCFEMKWVKVHTVLIDNKVKAIFPENFNVLH